MIKEFKKSATLRGKKKRESIKRQRNSLGVKTEEKTKEDTDLIEELLIESWKESLNANRVFTKGRNIKYFFEAGFGYNESPSKKKLNKTENLNEKSKFKKKTNFFKKKKKKVIREKNNRFWNKNYNLKKNIEKNLGQFRIKKIDRGKFKQLSTNPRKKSKENQLKGRISVKEVTIKVDRISRRKMNNSRSKWFRKKKISAIKKNNNLTEVNKKNQKEKPERNTKSANCRRRKKYSMFKDDKLEKEYHNKSNIENSHIPFEIKKDLTFSSSKLDKEHTITKRKTNRRIENHKFFRLKGPNSKFQKLQLKSGKYSKNGKRTKTNDIAKRLIQINEIKDKILGKKRFSVLKKGLRQRKKQNDFMKDYRTWIDKKCVTSPNEGKSFEKKRMRIANWRNSDSINQRNLAAKISFKGIEVSGFSLTPENLYHKIYERETKKNNIEIEDDIADYGHIEKLTFYETLKDNPSYQKYSLNSRLRSKYSKMLNEKKDGYEGYEEEDVI